GPKILVEWSQVETGRAVQDLRHGVRAKVGHGIRTLLCLRATRAKSQYKVGLTPASSAQTQHYALGFAKLSPPCVATPALLDLCAHRGPRLGYRSPYKACSAAIATIPAVSVRRIRGPSERPRKPAPCNASRSFSPKPPSGPTVRSSSPGVACRSRAHVVPSGCSVQREPGSVAPVVISHVESSTGASMAGITLRLHCFHAAVAT